MRVVDALTLSPKRRALLKPGEFHADPNGNRHRLPRFFYEIETWAEAKQIKLTAHFFLSELMSVDCREARAIFRQAPQYIPCAVSVLARYLEEFRARVDAPVCVSVNGGYRSPAHARNLNRATPHQWAAAADIYRVGENWLDSQKTIERYAKIAESIGPEVHVKPFGHGAGENDDHLHIDLGYLTLIPGNCNEDEPPNP
ncbi:MAG: Peptidase [Chthoniobacteraceae bacterium]|jgi:hypothetical protein|nr:Peptidase [Chthoniobacteraceae bacterium]MDB6171991.1 Peptidase [Chthoniobacteraceae bacterium]